MSMKVSEIRALLEDAPPNAEVRVAYRTAHNPEPEDGRTCAHIVNVAHVPELYSILQPQWDAAPDDKEQPYVVSVLWLATADISGHLPPPGSLGRRCAQ